MNILKFRISRLIYIFLIGLIILNLGCRSKKHDDIIVNSGSVEFTYYDVVDGKEMVYIKEIESQPVDDVINGWLKDLINLKVDYGTDINKKSILESLVVQDAFISDNTLILVVNDSFLEFDKNNTQPVYFLSGLAEILKQVINADNYSIRIGKDDRDIIHPDGLVIKNIPLKEQS